MYYYFDVDSKGKKKNEVDDVFENILNALYSQHTVPEVFGNTLTFFYTFPFLDLFS